MFKVIPKDYFSQLVENSLKSIIVDVDCDYRDQILFNIAKEDLQLYLMVKWGYDKADKNMFNEMFLDVLVDEGEPIKIFIDNFYRNWYKKWLQRVTVIPSNNNLSSNKEDSQATLLINIPRRVISNIDNYLLPLVECLFNHGEFACTKQIADRALKVTLAKSKHGPKTLEDELRLLNTVMSNMTDEVDNFDGALIFFKLGNKYFPDRQI